MYNSPAGRWYHTDRVIAPTYWPAFDQRTIEETDERVVSTQDDGITAKRLKHGTSMPRFIEHPVRSTRDWESVRARLDSNVDERYRACDRAAREVRERTTILRVGICGAYGTLRNLFGPENLCFALYDSPELVNRILDNWVAPPAVSPIASAP